MRLIFVSKILYCISYYSASFSNIEEMKELVMTVCNFTLTLCSWSYCPWVYKKYFYGRHLFPPNIVLYHLLFCIFFQYWRSEGICDDCVQFHTSTVQLELLPFSSQKLLWGETYFSPRKHCMVSFVTLHLFSALKKRRNGWWDWSPRVAVTFWKQWNTSTNSRT